MEKITKKGKLILYGCSGLGVNLLNIVMGSYLCSALLVGGFDKNVEYWTFLNKDLVVATLWATLSAIAKIVDGLIDLPLSHFTDNLKSKWGKRKTSIVIGAVPMLIAYVLFNFPLTDGKSMLNTIWFAALLMIFYACYTLTMLTYYGTFAEITKDQDDITLISNTKSVCDVVYFSLGFALVPALVNSGLNIRFVALLILPCALTMLIPLFMLKENNNEEQTPVKKEEKVTVLSSIMFTLKDKPYILWLCVLFVNNIGLQLFLSGINEYFSTLHVNQALIMPTCFVPVPFTIMLYNKVIKKRGLGFALRYVLLVYSIGMALMGLCNFIPASFKLPFALLCSLIVSFSIGSFFSITYMVPSQMAAKRTENGESASTMYYAIQGLFEAVSAAIGSSAILVFLKETGGVPFLTLIVAFCCMAAFVMTFFLPKVITALGKKEQ